MNTAEEIKQLVREKYGEIAEQSKETNAASCCGVGGCSTVDYTIMSEDYSATDGYVADADLGLGCGIPTEFAQIEQGNVVLDLGAGAGNDAFVARALVGSKGKVIGVDMTEAMVEKARINNDTLGFNNVEFRLGEIEKLPVGAGIIDVVISNCVLNLVPDKRKAFAEIFRVMKPGGHFSVSDIILKGNLPEGIRSAAEMYAGCVSGAIELDEYLSIINEAGFVNVSVPKDRKITIPVDILSNYLSSDEIAEFNSSGNQIASVTVYGEKPSDGNNPMKVQTDEPCCGDGCCS
ncbi:MAG: arsenite methyltransferase [Bacteroidetes bacterium]|nr:arsenite methyltransferase [Bacteroidota bacterium]